MFDDLSKKLKSSFKKLSGGGVLSEKDVDEALKEVRRSLLEADVHFKVVKDVCEAVRTEAVGLKVWEKLSPSQQVIDLFHKKLVNVLGGAHTEEGEKTIGFAGAPPVVVLIAGLQGSGKTTFCSKLALYVSKKLRKTVGLIPADCARPAAKDQLVTLARKINVPVFDSPLEKGAEEVARLGLQWAKGEFLDVVIVDTAGRQQVDEALMEEIVRVNGVLNPKERFLVVDAMIGSQGLEVAKTFHERLKLTGLVLSKLDGDARGGVALSARHVTGVPIYFASVGEKAEDLEVFHPDRMAQRVLGMGDVLSLIEKAKESISEEEAQANMEKMTKGQLSLNDFVNQMKMIRRMGPLEGLMKMIPGMGGMMDKLPEGFNAEREMTRLEAMVNSMTKEERKNPDILNARRKLRITKGSGTSVPELNRFMKQFTEMQKMMKRFSKMGLAQFLK